MRAATAQKPLISTAPRSSENRVSRRSNGLSESFRTKPQLTNMLQIQMHPPNTLLLSSNDEKSRSRERRKVMVLSRIVRSRSIVAFFILSALLLFLMRVMFDVSSPAGTSAMIVNMCEKTSRCDNFGNPAYNYTFLHISKCAGAAWIRLLKKRLPGFQPESETLSPSLEFMKNYGGLSSYYLVSLKSPRRHLWSLFTQCKYSRWGAYQTQRTNFPNDNQKHSARPNPETDDVDFEAWLDHFLLDGQPSLQRVDMYRCYHPSNFQSRSLTTHHYKARQALHESELRPNWDDVRARYWEEFHWVGLTEFFHESKCLLFYRLSLGPRAYPWADEFVNKHCRCTSSLSTKPNDTVVHHKESHRETFWNMRPDLLRRIEALTKVDVRLYRMALYQFLRETVWLESRLGRRVLCSDSLKRNEKELAYVFKGDSVSSVTGLYQAMKTTGEPTVVYY